LLPQGLLNLQIFEVRYLTMIRNSHKMGTPFGVVMLAQGQEVRQAATTERLMSHGCLAHVSVLDAIQPNLLRVQCVGGQRFRLEEHEQAVNGLWHANVSLLPDDMATGVPAHLQFAADRLRALSDQWSARGVDPDQWPWRGAATFGDCAWVAHRWLELLPLSPAQKHSAMLEADPVQRLQQVASWLKSF
jgi:Lon protease-like protein